MRFLSEFRGVFRALTRWKWQHYDAQASRVAAAVHPFRGGFRITYCGPAASDLSSCDCRRASLCSPFGVCLMASHNVVTEFRATWLPHVSDDGLRRLIDLLGKGSPLLIHGAFTRSMPMGCLATHIAWNHPRTCRLQHEAGIIWLSKIAGLNPATSAVILAWDRAGNADLELRADLYEACRDEQARRAAVELELEPATC